MLEAELRPCAATTTPIFPADGVDLSETSKAAK